MVVSGKLHKENNNLGKKDKGIPVISADGVKEYEIEEGEIIFRQDLTTEVEEAAKKYEETGDVVILETLGKTLTEELLRNTKDNYGKFKVRLKKDKDEIKSRN